MTRTLRLPHPQLLFLALAAGINILVLSLPRTPAVSVGAVLDMTLTVPALYYFLVARPAGRGVSSVGLVALLALWRTSFVFPHLIPGKVWIGAAVEALAIGLVVAGVLRLKATDANSDPATRIQLATRGILPFSGAEPALAFELTVLYYGLAWRAKPHIERESEAFSVHRTAGLADIFRVVGFASFLELVPVHLVVAQWSSTAAWVLSGLTVYGAFWAFAMARAFALRPTLVSRDEVWVRFGLLRQIRIPVEAIREVRREAGDVCLDFKRPLRMEALLGMKRTLTNIAVSADDAAGFERAVMARLV
jgi:hypothetical protein